MAAKADGITALAFCVCYAEFSSQARCTDWVDGSAVHIACGISTLRPPFYTLPMGRYRPPRRAGSPYITPEGEERLRTELHELWKVERPEVTKAVSAAAANGDRSENGDYIYGKKRLREIDSRVRFLRKRLDALQVVGGPLGDRNKAWFGAWVTLEDDEGTEKVWRIVGPDEFDVSQGKISCDSPLGRALLGQPVGNDIELETPEGQSCWTLVDVEYR